MTTAAGRWRGGGALAWLPAVAVLVGRADATASVTSISSATGSGLGGQRLYIYGEGFATNL